MRVPQLALILTHLRPNLARNSNQTAPLIPQSIDDTKLHMHAHAKLHMHAACTRGTKLHMHAHAKLHVHAACTRSTKLHMHA